MNQQNDIDEFAPSNIKKRALMMAIAELADPDFKIPNGFCIPLRNSLFVKQVTDREGVTVTAAGIHIVKTESTNTIIPCTGIVYSCGDEVTDMLRPGLKIMFADVQYPEVMIQGELYLKMYEHEVLAIIPPKTFVYQGVHSEAYLRRVKTLKMFADFRPKDELRTQNQKDKQEEDAKKLKGKK
jgi:co-chaperonin GroES (HSP10)